jgi:c-di-AMP phosphodiesterase-like protein
MPKLYSENQLLEIFNAGLQQGSQNTLNSISKFHGGVSEKFRNSLKNENLSNQNRLIMGAQTEAIIWTNEFVAQYLEKKVETLPPDILSNLAIK